MPGPKAIARRRQRQYDQAFARYAPDPVAETVELLDDHTLDSWIDAASHTGSWWAIPTSIRPQVRRRIAARRGAA